MAKAIAFIAIGVGLVVTGGLLAPVAGAAATGEEDGGIDVLPVPDAAEPEHCDLDEKDWIKIEGMAFPLNEFSTHTLAMVDGKTTDIGKMIFYPEHVQQFVDGMADVCICGGPKYESMVGFVTRAWVHEGKEVRFEGIVRDSVEARQNIPFAQVCVVLDFHGTTLGEPISAKPGDLIHPEGTYLRGLRLTRPGASGFPSTWVKISDDSKHGLGMPNRLNW